jgi:hypothetical protein
LLLANFSLRKLFNVHGAHADKSKLFEQQAAREANRKWSKYLMEQTLNEANCKWSKQ